MEHAGLAVARAARMLHPSPARLAICCGSGYNGGDGFCAAWQLQRWGYRPRILLAGSVKALREAPLVYARILRAVGVPIREVTAQDAPRRLEREWAQARLLIDALLGIGLTGIVRPLHAQLIDAMNRSRKPIVAVDVPSGLDADHGTPHGIAVKATVTVTFGLPKQGFFRRQGPAHVGWLFVDDIGIPQPLLGRWSRPLRLSHRLRRPRLIPTSS